MKIENPLVVRSGTSQAQNCQGEFAVVPWFSNWGLRSPRGPWSSSEGSMKDPDSAGKRDTAMEDNTAAALPPFYFQVNLWKCEGGCQPIKSENPCKQFIAS